ncbi:MAG: hypothetical protein IPL59_17675 [Candidatus Competibacteraceae bacterium]|nr:hypothetical protein [Candidatus Competibacteraceae bacterium]
MICGRSGTASTATLVLRGAFSDVLDHADAVTMTERGPQGRAIEFPGMGHAPR